MGGHLLEVRDLVVEFPRAGGPVTAARGVSFVVGKGETVGLVGESGCGKSATALALFRLVPPPGRILRGEVVLDGVSLLGLPEKDLRRYRGAGLAYVPQEPGNALNPVLSVASQIVDVIRAHRPVRRAEAWEQAVALLGKVGIPDPVRRAREYPHQFSGGMKQRVLMAMALSADPKVLIADEPTTALDVTLQAGILDLLRTLQGERDLSILLITHDLGVIAAACQRVLVMYAGRIVEEASVEALFKDPRHPYTTALIQSLPRPGIPKGSLPSIPGSVPDLGDLPPGCPFHPRCPKAIADCRVQDPPLLQGSDGRRVACLLHQPGPARFDKVAS